MDLFSFPTYFKLLIWNNDLFINFIEQLNLDITLYIKLHKHGLLLHEYHTFINIPAINSQIIKTDM